MNWLCECKGIIQVGAHSGQERKIFRRYPRLNVVYIEALPNVFEVLKQRTCGNPKWVSVCECVTDADGQDITFNISNNHGGQSSSIFEFDKHPLVWGHVKMIGKIQLKSVTLPSVMTKYNLKIENYSALFLDTQGSELKILEGAISLIKNFQYIHLEAWDFYAYKGACLIKDIEEYMARNGFVEHLRDKGLCTPNVGSTWNITYRRSNDRTTKI